MRIERGAIAAEVARRFRQIEPRASGLERDSEMRQPVKSVIQLCETEVDVSLCKEEVALSAQCERELLEVPRLRAMIQATRNPGMRTLEVPQADVAETNAPRKLAHQLASRRHLLDFGEGFFVLGEGVGVAPEQEEVVAEVLQNERDLVDGVDGACGTEECSRVGFGEAAREEGLGAGEGDEGADSADFVSRLFADCEGACGICH